MADEEIIMDRGGDRGLPDRGNLVARIEKGVGNIGGSIDINQVAVGTGPQTIAGDPNFEWDGTTLNIGVAAIGGNGGCNFGDGSIEFGPDGSALFNSVFTFGPQLRPSSPQEGMIYQDSTDHHLYLYNGTTWKQLDN